MATTFYRLVTALVWLVIVVVVVNIGGTSWDLHKEDRAAHSRALLMWSSDLYVKLVDDLAPYYSEPWIYYQDRDTAAEIAEVSKPKLLPELPEKYVEERYPEFHSRVRELIEVAKNERRKQRVRELVFEVLGALTIGGIFQLLWRWIMNPVMKKRAGQ